MLLYSNKIITYKEIVVFSLSLLSLSLSFLWWDAISGGATCRPGGATAPPRSKKKKKLYEIFRE
jgi:hypothetical protein